MEKTPHETVARSFLINVGKTTVITHGALA